MKIRVALGRLLLRLGRFLQSLPVVVMRPDDLVEFSRQSYSRPCSISAADREEWADSGLTPEEDALLKLIPLKQGKLLLLGVGTGRDAIPLSSLGFEVTGIDFVPELLEKAEKNATRHQQNIKVLLQEISNLDAPEKSFDVVWLSSTMYSSIPTAKRRVDMLRRIRNVLKPSGYFVCQFQLCTGEYFSAKVEAVRKIIAILTRGNLNYEKGDMLWNNREFIHAFSSEDNLKSEFKKGGFKIAVMQPRNDLQRSGAILQPEKK